MKSTLEKEKQFFLDYVNAFLQEGNDTLNENIILKRDHSLRVSQNMLRLASHIGLSSSETEFAGIIGLFHDIGRFTQYVKYNTFSDKDSVYHGDLGISVLDKLGKFGLFNNPESEILRKAIHNHGLAKIEDGLAQEEIMYAKMIRDADKMDIFKIVDAYYREMLQGKRNIALELGLKNENKLSSKVYATFLKEEVILKSDMHYINDFKLLQVAWIYDLNFAYTRDYLAESNYLNSIIDQITSDPHRENIRCKAMDFLMHKN